MSSLSPPRSLVTTNTTAANHLATFHLAQPFHAAPYPMQ